MHCIRSRVTVASLPKWCRPSLTSTSSLSVAIKRHRCSVSDLRYLNLPFRAPKKQIKEGYCSDAARITGHSSYNSTSNGLVRPNKSVLSSGVQQYSTMAPSDEFPLLNKLGLLSKDHIKIGDPARTEQIIHKIVQEGTDSLQVVADYDYTMTRVHDGNGVRCHCSWGALDNSPLMPGFYRSDTRTLLDKYYPIETSATMTEEEKIPHMVEWYKQVNALLSRCKISKHDLVTIVADSNTQLRSGSDILLAKLASHEVPVLVFSAGMGDIIEHVLDKFNVNSKNIKIVSNFFKFDEEDNVCGFQGDMIHMFNKNENAIHSSPYFDDMRMRTNVMLLGDSLGDIKMTRGVPEPHTSLKIGFLNDKMERLPAYMAAYDVVLMDDQTMDLANGVMTLIK